MFSSLAKDAISTNNGVDIVQFITLRFNGKQFTTSLHRLLPLTSQARTEQGCLVDFTINIGRNTLFCRPRKIKFEIAGSLRLATSESQESRVYFAPSLPLLPPLDTQLIAQLHDWSIAEGLHLTRQFKLKQNQ